MRTKLRKVLLTAVVVPFTAVAIATALPVSTGALADEAAAKAAPAVPAGPYDTTTKFTQAAYGEKMPAIVRNYLRATPYIGTGGTLDMEKVDALAELGFKTIVNLNTAKEGSKDEAAPIEAAGMSYINVEVPTKAPTPEQMVEIAAIIEDSSKYPILFHCESSNRVGAMWALYRASKGVPPEIAVEEGRTVGMKPNREAAVRERLGLSPL